MGDYWDVTIAQLQPLIAKPTLKPQLLQKPPFRFLHDIVTALMASTGFPTGLFPQAELDTEFVKAMDKDQKLAFLARLLTAVQIAVGREVDVSPSKIIAGLEPEKTNSLLVALAEAGHNAASLNMADIIAATDRGDKPQAQRAAPPAAAAAPAPVAAPVAAPAPAPVAKPRPAPAAAPAASSSGGPRPSRAPIELPGPAGDEDFVGVTTRLIGSLIQKPKMTDKLLRKPPFRFLHDILTGVLAATGFPDAYFSPQELDSGSFADTAAKLSFLQRLIDIVGATTGADLSQVNPKKIAAGLEPELTNLLLQQLAYAAASGIAATDAAAKMASGGAVAAAPAPRDTRAEEAAAAEAAAAAERKAKAAAEAEARKAAALAASQAQQQAAAAAKPMPKLGLSGLESDESKEEDASAAAAGGRTNKIERPKTARKAPPKLASNLIEEKKKSQAEDEKKSLVNDSGVALIAEGENQADEGDDDDDDAEDRTDLMGGDALAGFDAADGGADDGMVVKAMKDKLKGLSDGGGMKIRSSATISGGMSQAQLDELRRQIQTLCQSVNPLGKCIDFVREDVDAMNKELTRWRAAYTEYTEELETERKSTERIVEPLQNQLQEVEAQIAEQQRKIHSLKGTILRNDATIQQLLDAAPGPRACRQPTEHIDTNACRRNNTINLEANSMFSLLKTRDGNAAPHAHASKKSHKKEDSWSSRDEMNEHKYDDENDVPVREKKHKKSPPKSDAPVKSSSLGGFFSVGSSSTSLFAGLGGAKKRPSPSTTPDEKQHAKKKKKNSSPIAQPIPSFNSSSSSSSSPKHSSKHTAKQSQSHSQSKPLTGIASSVSKKTAKVEELYPVSDLDASMEDMQPEPLAPVEDEEEEMKEEAQPRKSKKKDLAAPIEVPTTVTPSLPAATVAALIMPSASLSTSIAAAPKPSVPSTPNNFARRTPPKPAAISTHSVETSTTPLFLRSSLLTPAPVSKSLSSHHHHHLSSTTSSTSTSSLSGASALLHDFRASTALQKVLAEKEALMESLLGKYAALKAAKKADMTDLLEKHTDDGLASAAAMVAHYKAEAAERQVTIDRLQKEAETVPAQLAAFAHDKQRQTALNQALQTQVDTLARKLAAAEAQATSTQAELQQAREQASSQQSSLTKQASHQQTELTKKIASLEASAAEQTTMHRAEQARAEKIERAYRLLTAMEVHSKEDAWVQCRIVNDEEERVVEFNLEADAEEEVEYAPTKIDMNGVNYPGWMAEGLLMERAMAPRLLKIMLQNVFKKDDEQ